MEEATWAWAFFKCQFCGSFNSLYRAIRLALRAKWAQNKQKQQQNKTNHFPLMCTFTALLVVWKGWPADEDSFIRARSLFFPFFPINQGAILCFFWLYCHPCSTPQNGGELIKRSWWAENILIPVNIWRSAVAGTEFIWPSTSQARLSLTYDHKQAVFFSVGLKHQEQ